jgi:hypothetical protein
MNLKLTVIFIYDLIVHTNICRKAGVDGFDRLLDIELF